MEQKKTITLIDTTLRDGLQHEEHYLPLEQRLQLLDRLLDAGVRKLEVGSFAHPGYVPQFREIDDFALMLPRRDDVEYTFLALNRRAVERTLKLKELGAPIHRVLGAQIATSASYAKKNLNRSHEELFREAEESVRMLHEGGIPCVVASVGTIFGCPIEGPMPLEKGYEFTDRLLDMGFDEIEHADAAGVAAPEEMAHYCAETLRRHPDPRQHVLHIHDVSGRGLSCYYAAMQQGIERFECTLGGIGGQPANRIDGIPVKGTGAYYYEHGRTGLVSLEDWNDMLCRMGYETGIDRDRCIAAGHLAERFLGRELDSFVVAVTRSDLLHCAEPCAV